MDQIEPLHVWRWKAIWRYALHIRASHNWCIIHKSRIRPVIEKGTYQSRRTKRFNGSQSCLPSPYEQARTLLCLFLPVVFPQAQIQRIVILSQNYRLAPVPARFRSRLVGTNKNYRFILEIYQCLLLRYRCWKQFIYSLPHNFRTLKKIIPDSFSIFVSHYYWSRKSWLFLSWCPPLCSRFLCPSHGFWDARVMALSSTQPRVTSKWGAVVTRSNHHASSKSCLIISFWYIQILRCPYQAGRCL